MIDQTIQDLESRIHKATTLSDLQRKELQALVDNLRKEVAQLAQTHPEGDGIRASVERFEKTHPVLTRTVNDIATYFSNLGI